MNLTKLNLKKFINLFIAIRKFEIWLTYLKLVIWLILTLTLAYEINGVFKVKI